MIPIAPSRCLALTALLIAVIAAVPAAAQPPAPQTASTIYLPLVAKAGTPHATPTAQPTTPTTPPPVTPTPTQPAPPQKQGFFALSNWLTYNAATAVDASGGIHLAFTVSDEKHDSEPSGEPALYTYCPGPASACADPATWSDFVIFERGVSEVQVAVTPDGRPRLLVRRDREGYNWTEYLFYACEQQCTSADNWRGQLVAQPADGIDPFVYSEPQHSFALDSQGRPRFIFYNGYGNGKPDGIFYAYCDADDCTQPDTWSMAPIIEGEQYKTTTAGYASLAFDGTRPRVLVMRKLTWLPDSLRYFACDADDCGQLANWQNITIPYPADKQWANWDLALDKDGHPRLALYEPENIDIFVGGRLFYATCDEGCLDDIQNWTFTQVAHGEGKSVDLAIDAQGRTHMVYDAGQRGALTELWCDAGCDAAEAWQRRVLETNEQLMADFAPASPLSCNQQERIWVDALPTAAFDAAGNLVVAYDTRNVAACYYYDPTDPMHRIYSHVERLWWSVRWAQFARP